MSFLAPLSDLNRRVDRLVGETPAERDRYIDFLRAASILVVILWHWVFTLAHWSPEGRLVTPNPIDHVPGAWLITWVLQVMPVFFIVGGFSNLVGWRSVRRGGGGAYQFYVRRLRRLLTPVLVFLLLWLAVDALLLFALPNYLGVLHYGFVVFTPLWFVGVYLWVILLAPLTARLHDKGKDLTVVLMGIGIVLADLLRFRYRWEPATHMNTGLVWIFVHQLGYFYADGTLGAAPRRRHWTLLASGLGGLVVLTSLPGYPRSMVATEIHGSNMFPTTAAIASLAVVQLGVLMLARPAATRWLEGARAWKGVVGVNAFIMTIFVWHFTALLGAIWIYERLGGRLIADPTAAWWLQRPLWLVLPGLLLLVMVPIFARFER